MTDEVVRSARGPEQLQLALGEWLATRVPGAVVTHVEVPSSNGMSSETVLLDARWDDGGGIVERALVARIAPEASAVPVFPTYDLEKQARVMADARAAVLDGRFHNALAIMGILAASAVLLDGVATERDADAPWFRAARRVADSAPS